MTDAERQRHRALDHATAHMDAAVKNLSASIKQALQSTTSDISDHKFSKTGNA